MGAAIAFYTMFSLAPLLILAVAVAGLVFGRHAAEGALLDQLSGIVGPNTSKTIQTVVEAANTTRSGLIATVIGVVTIVIGATSVFAELQGALNVIWRADPPSRSGVWALVKGRLLSMVLVGAVGLMLLASAGVGATLAFLQQSGTAHPVLDALHIALIFGLTTLFFAAIFKILPDRMIEWRDVWLGALVSAVLFTLGRYVIGLYIAHTGTASVYGGAGALVVVLIWVYYSAQILLFGAALAKVHGDARRPTSSLIVARGSPPARG